MKLQPGAARSSLRPGASGCRPLAGAQWRLNDIGDAGKFEILNLLFFLSGVTRMT